MKVDLFFFRWLELAEGTLSLGLYRRPQVLLAPLPDLCGRNRLQRVSNHLVCRGGDQRARREHQPRNPTLRLLLFEPFEFAEDRFNHLTAPEQALVRRGFGRFRLDKGEQLVRHAVATRRVRHRQDLGRQHVRTAVREAVTSHPLFGRLDDVQQLAPVLQGVPKVRQPAVRRNELRRWHPFRA